MDIYLHVECWCLMVLYCTALALTLAMSAVEVTMSERFNDDDFTWEETFHATGLTSLKTWRACCWARFWLIACR